MLSPETRAWDIASDVSEWIEILAILFAAVLLAFAVARRPELRGELHQAYLAFRRQGPLLGLDLLIAADIIRIVTLEPIIENVAASGLLVVVRTFLACSLLLETENRWPWHPQRADATDL